jgi:hypothetical protein
LRDIARLDNPIKNAIKNENTKTSNGVLVIDMLILEYIDKR